MRRLLPLLLLPVLAAAGLALADGPARAPSAAERLRRFRQERALVRKLVESGLRLAQEADPLQRADECKLLAGGLTQEIQRLVKEKDGNRADALGKQLEALLVRGVAGNLNRARSGLAPNSPALPELRRLAREAIAVTDPLQAELDQVAGPEQEQMQGIQQAVTQGRAELEKALRGAPGKGRPGLKAPPVGKKLKKD
jgi:hypothetical protein